MVTEILAQLDNAVGSLQTLLYVDVVQPIFFKVGLMGYDEDTYDALYWVIIGALEVLATFAILRPLEALRPIEKWQDRKAVRSDVFYTWIAKLGIINLAFFFLLTPVFNHWQSLMVIHGIPNIDVDSLWPGVTDQPVVSFVIYLIVLDFAGYWYHRWQHRFGVWWELHAVHHSQQQMSLWADDRNHFLDDMIQAAFFAGSPIHVARVPCTQLPVTTFCNGTGSRPRDTQSESVTSSRPGCSESTEYSARRK